MKENPDTNMNASNERIDELLNGYIDDELTAEQKAEVENLVGQDVKIGKRLRQFQKCRILVGSIPVAEAPAGVMEGVKATLPELSLPVEKQLARGMGKAEIVDRLIRYAEIQADHIQGYLVTMRDKEMRLFGCTTHEDQISRARYVG